MSTPTPECDRANLLLVDYAYGELAGPTLAELEQHLPGCDRCQSDLHALRSTRRVMTALEPVPAPEAGLESLLAYAEQQAARQAKPKKAGWLRWLSAAVPIAAVATLVLTLAPQLKSAAPSVGADTELRGKQVADLSEPPQPTPAAAAPAVPATPPPAQPVAQAEAPRDEAKLAAKEEAKKEAPPAPAKPAEPTGQVALDLKNARPDAKPSAAKVPAATGAENDRLAQGKDLRAGGKREQPADDLFAARGGEEAQAATTESKPEALAHRAKGGRKADTGGALAATGDAVAGPAPAGALGANAIGAGQGAPAERPAPKAKTQSLNKDVDLDGLVASADKADQAEKTGKAKEKAAETNRGADEAEAADLPAQPRAEAGYKAVAQAKKPEPRATAPAPVVAAAPAPPPPPMAAPLEEASTSSSYRSTARDERQQADALVDAFRAGYQAQRSGQPAVAAREFQRAYQLAPSGARAAEALFHAAEAQAAAGQAQQAVTTYLEVASRFAGSSFAPQALAQASDLASQIGDPDRASALRQRLVQEYPNSPLARPAGGGGTVMKPGQYAAPARAESPKKRAAKPSSPKMDFEDRAMEAPAPAAAPPAATMAK